MNTCLHRDVGLVTDTNFTIQYDFASQACDSIRFDSIIYSIILDISGRLHGKFSQTTTTTTTTTNLSNNAVKYRLHSVDTSLG